MLCRERVFACFAYFASGVVRAFTDATSAFCAGMMCTQTLVAIHVPIIAPVIRYAARPLITFVRWKFTATMSTYVMIAPT